MSALRPLIEALWQTDSGDAAKDMFIFDFPRGRRVEWEMSGVLSRVNAPTNNHHGQP